MQPQPHLCDMNLQFHISASDERRSDLLARGTALFGGLPTCGDASLASPLHADGSPWRRADQEDGVVIARVNRQHYDDYPELVASSRVHFLMLSAEIGGRLHQEAIDILQRLAAAKAAALPQLLRRGARLTWYRRWLSMVSVSIQMATMESILQAEACLFDFGTAMPAYGELPAGQCSAPPASRLPLR